MSTSTQQSEIDFSRADHLQKDEVVSRKGLVDATLVQKMDEPKHLVDWYRLSNNEEIKIPAGCAMAFKVDGGWKKAHFFEDGRIVGPLVCAVDAVESPKKLYRSRFFHQMSPFDAIIMLVITFVFGVTLFPRPDEIDLMYYVATFATAITSFAFLGFTRIFLNYRFPYWRGDEACLEKLKETTKGPVEI